MRIAITYDEETGQVYQHFGHTEKFKLYDTDNRKILSTTVIPTAGSGHAALAQFLIGQGVDAVICGGIGLGMQEALMRESLLVYGGVKGSGFGKDLSHESLLEYTVTHHIMVERAQPVAQDLFLPS